ncbi:hypothetical protein LTR65_010232 [Meristemomyces frigidus]
MDPILTGREVIKQIDTWFDTCGHLDVDQAYAAFTQAFPDPVRWGLGMYHAVIKTCYERFEPIQNEINHLYSRLELLGPAYADVNRYTNILEGEGGGPWYVQLRVVPVHDVLSLRFMSEAELRFRIVELAVATRGRLYVRNMLNVAWAGQVDVVGGEHLMTRMGVQARDGQLAEQQYARQPQRADQLHAQQAQQAQHQQVPRQAQQSQQQQAAGEGQGEDAGDSGTADVKGGIQLW